MSDTIAGIDDTVPFLQRALNELDMPRERRRFPRRPASPDRNLAVLIDDRGFPYPCTLIDESEGGISVDMSDPSRFPAGIEVEVTFDGRRRRGRVRHVTEMVSGCWKVGISWESCPALGGTVSPAVHEVAERQH